jgi:PHP family Zn ribbon phosphoesterase
MVPTEIVRAAKERGLDAVGICDHNSAENAASVKSAAEREGVRVLEGMEITSREEVHVLTLFDDEGALAEMQRKVYENLSGENDEAYFGQQFVVDEHDGVTASNRKLLIGSTDIGIDEIAASARALGGAVIASHVDREAFGVIGQLGFIPEELALDALELSAACKGSDRTRYEALGFPLVSSSDAHFLKDVGATFTTCYMDVPSVAELLLAFRGADGRKVML